jgi:hypothetical protein
MIEITLNIIKADVYKEVAKTTSYTGSKMMHDDEAYDRIFTTDEDRQMLERFWTEACNGATEEFKQFILEVSDPTGTDYEVTLELSSSFDKNLKSSIETSLFSYFVNSIISKWNKFANKGESESYATDADAAMLDVRSKIFFKKKPKRVVPE